MPGVKQRAVDQAGAAALELYDEAFAALFTIVRQSMLGFPIGHDAMVRARSVVRRMAPDAYADLVKRRDASGLEPFGDGEEGTLP